MGQLTEGWVMLIIIIVVGTVMVNHRSWAMRRC
jgi:hypothetical protein